MSVPSSGWEPPDARLPLSVHPLPLPAQQWHPPPAGRPGRSRRSGPRVALLIILTLVLILFVAVGGGGVYLATHRGHYPKAVWACALTSPADLVAIVPGGVQTSYTHGSESSCTWGNRDTTATGEEVHLTVRTKGYGITRFGSADRTAHHWWRDRVKANIVQAAGIPISGYGDEAVRLPKAYSGAFDAIVFRDSNLVVEVAVQIDFSPGRQPTIEAWRRTQQAARLVTRQLEIFRR